ncbi:hypothetical protein B0H67DRAFT_571956 [Lasiosphaeris hirsuta]|uniref:Methyltransferase n=1 Tax=Lasiosphaeris hirsuta TaxID=260670 RepID=A0AA40B1H7_9PEZI|nr:hypothetical protein B0H67DRAFT_571956 [Lasiosphaeris hirsuta]
MQPSHLKPDGYVEFQELEYRPRCGDTLLPDTPHAFRDYLSHMKVGLQIYSGTDIDAVRKLSDELKVAGFQDVQTTARKCPLGSWSGKGRDVQEMNLGGMLLKAVFLDGLTGVSRRPFMALGWTEQQIEMFLIDVRKAIVNPEMHVYFNLHVVYGKKPLLPVECGK